MEILALLEFAGVIFVGASLYGQMREAMTSVAAKRIRILSVLVMVWLFVDAFGYAFNESGINYWVMFINNMLIYIMSNLVMIGFLSYCEAFIREKTKLSKWVFSVPILVFAINIIIVVIYYFQDKLVVYQDGVFVIIGTVPVFVLINYMIGMIYAPIIAFIRRDDVGKRTVVLLMFFGVPVIISIIILLITDIDLSVTMGAASVIIISRLLQNNMKRENLEESLMFTDYFLSTYISAYYVDLVNLTYKVYKRTEELDRNYPVVSNYFESVSDYIENEVHPQDRQALINLMQPEEMKAILKEKPEFTHIFRNISKGEERIIRLQVIRGVDDNHAAFGFVDITSEIQEQTLQMNEIEESRKLIESIASSYNIAYVVNIVEDSFRLLRMDENMLGSDVEFATFSQAKEFFFKVVHHDDKANMEKQLDYDYMRERLESVPSYKAEYRVPIDGVSLWHEMSVTLIDKDEVAIGFAVRDFEITKRKMAEIRYDEYFALYVVDLEAAMIKTIKNDYWYKKSRAGDFQSYSTAIYSFANVLAEEPGNFFRQFADIEYAKETLKNDDKTTYTYKSIYENREKWIEVTGYVISRNSDGSPSMFTVGFSFVDAMASERQEFQRKIAEQKNLLEASYKQLEVARNAADEANKSKTNFLFNMSHDIRTPMNAITGFTMMAKKYVDEREKVVEYLDKIEISGQQLLTLINQVLEMARIESGKMEINETVINLTEKFSSMVTVFCEQAKAYGLEFCHSNTNIKQNSVFADDARLSSVIINIVGNAMKYTPEGGKIDFELKEIPSRKEGYGTYVITVSDTGIGMSEEYQKRLFEPFSRENNTTVSKVQGTGLGMSIVKSLVDNMGGDIEVHSEVGKGTRFDVTLDLKISNEEVDSSKKTKDSTIVTFAGCKVLVAEDNEMNREIIKYILEECGIEVEEAEDGEEVVAKYKEKTDKQEYNYYDYILMDVQMPKMNGYEATKKIREISVPDDVHVPIIAMTANAFEEDKKNAFDAGMDDHLSKPIDVRKLLETLAKYR